MTTQPPPQPAPGLQEAVLAAGRAAGLDAVGIATAEPFDDTRHVLEERKAAGLHGGMAFTYRNPDRSTDPGRTLPGATALVVGARSYHRRRPSSTIPPTRAGDVARYSWEDHYAPLRVALGAVKDTLEAAGHRATVVVDDNALVDRAAARRAGLGWYGKNANLLLPGAGSWFVLGSVLTDAPLTPTTTATAAATQDGCGACDRCLPACPTGAIVAPGVLDARRCLAWLLEAPGVFPVEHRAALGARIYGCDDCQEACPPNRVELRRHPPPLPAEGAQPTVDVVLDILDEDHDQRLLERFGRWYVAERHARHLRRNALVVLGNVGDADDEPTRRAIHRALQDDDPIVRAHAVWAARRLDRGRDGDGSVFTADLERLRRHETDPLVRAELAADVADADAAMVSGDDVAARAAARRG
jgi:epoxyqueuosine reductase